MTRDLIGYGKDYPRITWPNNARIAISLVVQFEEGDDGSPPEGNEQPEFTPEGVPHIRGRRQMSLESLYEYGSRRGFWRLMEIFDQYGVKSTFFCSGRALERNPAAAREITAQGHEPCGHGYWWTPYPYPHLSREEEKEDIKKTIEVIEKTTGQRPLGWNSPAPSPNTRELLIESGGFVYDSDSYNDDLPYFVDTNGKRILTVPCTVEVSDAKFWAIPGQPGFVRPGNFLAMMKAAFDCLYSEGATHPKMMSVSLRPRIAGRPSRATQVEEFIRYAKGFSGVWFARRVDIAKWWLEHYKPS